MPAPSTGTRTLSPAARHVDRNRPPRGPNQASICPYGGPAAARPAPSTPTTPEGPMSRQQKHRRRARKARRKARRRPSRTPRRAGCPSPAGGPTPRPGSRPATPAPVALPAPEAGCGCPSAAAGGGSPWTRRPAAGALALSLTAPTGDPTAEGRGPAPDGAGTPGVRRPARWAARAVPDDAKDSPRGAPDGSGWSKSSPRSCIPIRRITRGAAFSTAVKA